jgi:hypothetical protein
LRRSKLKPTTEETFAVGKLEGEREVLLEMQEYLDCNFTVEQLRAIVKSRIKILMARQLNDPFKTKEKR